MIVASLGATGTESYPGSMTIYTVVYRDCTGCRDHVHLVCKHSVFLVPYKNNYWSSADMLWVRNVILKMCSSSRKCRTTPSLSLKGFPVARRYMSLVDVDMAFISPIVHICSTATSRTRLYSALSPSGCCFKTHLMNSRTVERLSGFPLRLKDVNWLALIQVPQHQLHRQASLAVD